MPLIGLAIAMFMGMLPPAWAEWVALPQQGIARLALGNDPGPIAIAQGTRLMAVGLRDRHAVVLLDPDSGAELRRIGLPDEPAALAITANGTRVYALVEGKDEVFVLDAAGGGSLAERWVAGRLAARWDVGGKPVALALSGNEAELFVAGNAGRLVGVRTADGTVTRSKDLQLPADLMAMGLHGLRLMVAGKGMLVSLDAGTWNEIRRSPLAEEVTGLSWWDHGNLALALTRGNDGLVMVDPETGRIDAQGTLTEPPKGMGVDQERDRAYAAVREDEALYRYQLMDRAWAGRYVLPEPARAVVIDPVSGTLYATTSRSVLSIQPDEAALQEIVTLSKGLRDIAVDNRKHQAVLAGKNNGVLYRVPLGSRKEQSLALPGKPYRVAVDANLHLAVIARTGKGHQIGFADLSGDSPKLFPETIKLQSPVSALAVDPTRGLTLAVTERGDLLLLDNRSRKSLRTIKADYRYRYGSADVDTATGLVYLAMEGRRGYSRFDLAKKAIKDHWTLPFKQNVIAIDPALRMAVIAEQNDAVLHLLDLDSHAFIGSLDLPDRPVAMAIQPDTHLAAVAIRASNSIVLVDLKTRALKDTVYSIKRPFALAVSTRYNQLLALSAESDEVVILRLPSPLPVLDALHPAEALRGGAGLSLSLKGAGFIEGSTAYFNDTALATRWVGGNELSADVPASLLAAGATTAVSVVNPEPEGGRSEERTFSVLNPAPVLSSVAPASLEANAGNAGITLTGDKFLPESEVYFGAQLLPSTYVGTSRLTAMVPASLLTRSGTVPVTVFNPTPGGGLSAAVAIKVVGESPTIRSFAPESGPVGTVVSIDGSNFDALNPGANDVRFGGERAMVSAATSTRLTAIVPIRAVTGRISVMTQKGSTTSASDFTVRLNQDFQLALEPATLQVPPGGTGVAMVKLQSTGLAAYAHAATLAVSNLPAGLSARFGRAAVDTGHPVQLAITAGAGATPGTYAITLTATGNGDTAPLARSQAVTLQILAAGGTTVGGRVLHAEDDSPFVGARIRLGGQEAYTDAAGAYRFSNPGVAGDQVILVDGHTANTAGLNYPSAIAVPIMIVAGKDNVALTSYIQAVKADDYTAITPGAATDVTKAELPGYALRIPQGAVLYGWDGTPVTKVNVRTVPVDRLPIRPVPDGVNTRTVYLYYFYREGGANPTQPIPVTMANDFGALPGEKVDLWYYDESTTPDANSNQWRIMGQGTVSEDGLSIVSDPGVGIPKFCCGATFASPPPPPVPPGGDGNGPKTCNPVDLATGIASVFDDHSLGLNGLFKTRVGCRYSSRSEGVGPFGRGTWLNLEWQLAVSTGSVTLLSPQGIRYTLTRDPDGRYRMAAGRRIGVGLEAYQQSGRYTVRWPDGSQDDYQAYGRGNQGLVAQTDANGNRTAIQRDGTGRVQSITDPNGHVYQLQYSGTLVSRLAGPQGKSLDFTYDGAARLTQVTDHAGRTTQYQWDGNNRITAKTAPNGAVTRYTYDAAGRAVEETFADGGAYRMDYLVSAGQVMETQVTDPEGHLTTYRFNGQGYLVKTLDPLGRVHSQLLDTAKHLLLSETDPAGRTTRYTYDARGNRTSVKDPLGQVTLTDYDPLFNKPTQVTDPLGRTRTYSYDGQGNLTAATNPAGETTRLTYTPRGQIETLTDPLGHVTRFSYESQGNLVETTDPLGHRTRQAYDAANRLIETVDALGSTTKYAYDALDRLTRTTDPLGGITALDYDVTGNLLTYTDALGHAVERNAYDLRNRLTRRTDALEQSETHAYDKNGNHLTTTDRQGRTTTYAYDALNRLTRLEDPDGRTTTYDYDLAGNVSRISDNESGDLLIDYDALDRPIHLLSNQGRVEYQYDALGQRTRRTVNDSETTTYTYDPAGRVTRIEHGADIVTYTYDRAGRLTKKTLPNGVSQAYTWDAAHRLTQIRLTQADGSEIDSLDYTYDANGQRTAKSGQHASAPETPFTANYDAAHRLTTLTHTQTNETWDLAYDAAGHLLKKTRRGDGAETRYTWNARGKLARIDGPSGTARFQYDALGRRTGKTVNGQTTNYLYDGDQAVAELVGSSIGAVYLTGLNLDEALARITPLATRSQVTDALGSVLREMDAQGKTTASYAYSPYGETNTTGEAGNPVQYTANPLNLSQRAAAMPAVRGRMSSVIN